MIPLSEEPLEAEDLLQKFLAGEQHAVEEMIARQLCCLSGAIAIRLDRRIQSRVDAADVIQDAQIEACRRIARFVHQRPMPFKLWLRKTAYECLLRLRRQHVDAKRRAVEREVPLSNQLSQILATRGDSPSELLVAQELALSVRDALTHLKDSDREILILRSFQGMSNQEVAGVLEIATDAARKRYARALLRLRKILVEGGFSELQI